MTAVQNYWDERPCNIRHSTREVGSREYFDEVEARKYLVELHIPGFAEFPRWRDKKVLEIGCGIGTDTINFARYGAEVTTVELSPRSMEIAQQRARVFNLEDRIRFVSGNAEELTQLLPKNDFNLIYSFGVIHHSPNPEEIIRQARAFAKPGTTIKAMVYHRLSWKVLWIVLRYGKGRFWRQRELVAHYSEAQTGCPITYTYSRREGRRLLERNGFRVLKTQVDHIFPYRIEDYKQHRYVKQWYFRWMPRWMFRALERAFGWHLCLTGVATDEIRTS